MKTISLAILFLSVIASYAYAASDALGEPSPLLDISESRMEQIIDRIVDELALLSDGDEQEDLNEDDMKKDCGTADGYPICCPGRYIDPDHDNWGWQDDSYSCRVVDGVSGNPKSGGGGGGSSGGVSGGSCPSFTCPSGIGCGCYLESGLGNNKVAYLKAGANLEFLASAMMETNKMDAKSYALGDNKSYDSFNAGATKMNWGMMRKCHPAFRKFGAAAYKQSAKLNSNKKLDVQVYKECRKHFGGKWLSGHRNGETGLNHPNTPDIKQFQRGMDWTVKMLKNHPETQRNDVRFWVSIGAI